VGTEAYISPEAIEQRSSDKITCSSDLWSLGVIIWQIFSKKNTTPFADSTQEKTFMNIK
jgi:serine/threonine protein kinase